MSQSRSRSQTDSVLNTTTLLNSVEPENVPHKFVVYILE